jgi:sterol desaturase/sphingolipid hydroxylase (fatty acid hydroxylase superfamily)
VHHSSERLYFLNSNRFHPVDAALTTVAFVAPLSLLGVGPEVLVLHTIVNAINGAFKHGNVDVRLGPLNWLVSLGELHRWHHSPKIEEASHNYGTNLILWDVVFGTRSLPRDREPPEEVGLGAPGYPQSYLAQLLEPLARRSPG